MKIEVYTDGSYFEKHSTCGWGVYIKSEKGQIKFSGCCNCDNSLYVELLAVLKALEYIESYVYDVTIIDIFTDCDFIVKVADSYRAKRGVIYRTKSTLRYKKLINQILGYTSIFNIKWNAVKSHRGIKGNEIADTLAKKAVFLNLKQKREG